MNSERKLISTHIEKTAGTSIQNLYQTAIGRDRLAIYYAREDKLHRATDSAFTNASPFVEWFKSTLMDTPFYASAKDLAFWAKSLRSQNEQIEIPQDVMIIHGHFRSDRFDEAVDDPLRSIIFREPLDRMRSQYDHWKKAKGHLEWRVKVPYDSTMSFEDYALLPELQNYQTQAVAGKPLSDFHVVGVTDNIDRYRDSILQLFVEQGWGDKSMLENVSVPKLNQTSRQRKTASNYLSDTFRREFQRFHEADYQIYEEARRIST